MNDPYQPCPYCPLNEYGGPLGLPPLLQIGDVRLLLPPLVVRRDDDLRVAEPRHLLARGEAAVRLLDERGQVVDARPPQLLQDLDLVQWGGKLLAILHERCQTAEDRDNKDFALRLKLSEKEKFGGRRAVS